MKTRQVAIAIFSLMGAIATPSFASDAAVAAAQEIIQLKEGSRLYVFRNGTTALEDRYGRAAYLIKGQVLDAVDGRKITINSNEVARLSILLTQGHEGS